MRPFNWDQPDRLPAAAPGGGDWPEGNGLGVTPAEPIPADLAALVRVDALLAAAPPTVFGSAEAPEGLAGRVYLASAQFLPRPVIGRIDRTAARSVQAWWARVAVAAAALLAVLAGTLVSVKTAGVDRAALARAPRAPAQPEVVAAPEATLVALLEPASAGSWFDEHAFTSTTGRSVAPLLQTRGTAIDDIASELQGILGDEDSHSM